MKSFTLRRRVRRPSVRPAAVLALGWLCLMLAAGPARAEAQAAIPDAVQGVWAERGACSDAAKTVTLTADTLAYGSAPPAPVHYDTGASPDGFPAILSSQEGKVSNFEYIADKDTLAYNQMGFGAGEPVPYTRCTGAGATEASAAGGASAERCGWLANLTPGDWWLVDRDGTWTISQQGSMDQALLAKLPDFDTKEFVTTQGDYGYGCACLTVTTSAADKTVTAIAGGKIEPLATCKADKALPAIDQW